MLSLLYTYLGISMLNFSYYCSFLKFSFRKEKARTQQQLPVSVIICAKNEAPNLQRFLPSILSQNHPDFEVVLINDASVDDTLEVMESFQRQDPRVQIVDVKNNETFWGKKKYALTLGIKKASNPYLLFTDADCEPQSNEWISEMSATFTTSTSIVLGYGGYFKEKFSLLNKLIRFETFLTAIQYFSYALWGSPYMGVGRNLAYTSREFYSQVGFASHLHIRSGDDDLFVNRAATKHNTDICIAPEAVTMSLPKESFRQWLTQKRRHTSVAKHYKLKHKILLGTFYLTQLLFWGIFLLLMFGPYWKAGISVLVARLLLQGMVYYKAGKKLGEADLVWLFPFLELFLICSQLGIFIANIISKPNHWK